MMKYRLTFDFRFGGHRVPRSDATPLSPSRAAHAVSEDHNAHSALDFHCTPASHSLPSFLVYIGARVLE
jgi:hypothetical protein